MNAAARWLATPLLLWPPILAAQPALPPELERLRSPQISTRPAEKVLVVEARGDPRSVGGAAFGLLFQLYYQIPETAKGPQQPAPQARWPVPLDRPRAEWIGFYGMPVPEAVAILPTHSAPAGLRASLSSWEYGTVVEILHIGPYDQEAPSLRRLEAFATARGYVVSGEHEEEYIRGPTMTGPGDPAAYLTILRYRVTKQSND